MDIKKDLLYKDNKYVNSNKLILDRSYIRQKRLHALINVSVLLSILLIGAFGIYFGTHPVATIDNKKYAVQTDLSQLDIGDRVLFSYKEEIDWKDRMTFYGRLGYVGEIGEVISLSQGINPETNRQIEQGKVLVTCLTSGCEGVTKEVAIKTLYGITKED